MIEKSLLAAVLALAAFPVFAQVEVVDRPVNTLGSDDAAVAPAVEAVNPNSAAQNTAEMYYQVQVLQQEVLQLRGLVEEQAYQIKQLKQQRLDDYVDLDRRLSKLSTQAVNSSGSPTQNTTTNPPTKVSTDRPQAVNPAGEIAHYKSATKLILVDKNYEGGIQRLQEHLKLYPNGRYHANAQYWLGEVYLATSKLDESRGWFEKLLETHPTHSKAPDAKYKLGTVYFKLNMLSEAKSLLLDVSRSGGNAAQLASRYLKEHNL
jgi:tol-pal system protein YbgF